MGVREWLDQHRRTAMGMGAGIVVIAVVSVVWQVMAQRKTFPSGSTQSFFTVDDGKTYFADSDDNVPPYDYKGQQAVKAYVYECEGKRFVGYLERYLPDARQSILAGKKTIAMDRFGREVKRPGESKWTKSGGPEESKLCMVPCPDGHGTPGQIEP